MEHFDITIDLEGTVSPNSGGMSINIGAIDGMADFRLPLDFGGKNEKDVLWTMNSELVTPLGYGRLLVIPDSSDYNPNHGLIVPAYTMKFEDFEEAINSLQHAWNEEQKPTDKSEINE